MTIEKSEGNIGWIKDRGRLHSALQIERKDYGAFKRFTELGIKDTLYIVDTRDAGIHSEPFLHSTSYMHVQDTYIYDATEPCKELQPRTITDYVMFATKAIVAKYWIKQDHHCRNI